MHYIRRFDEITADDVPLVGGKNSSLGEMTQSLRGEGVEIPEGFAITAAAFVHFLESNDLRQRIDDALAALDPNDLKALASTGGQIRKWITNGDMPNDLADEIHQAYSELEKKFGKNPDVAVRSSATAEDLPSASFAGQQETYLNIRGTRSLLDTCRRVFASLFTDRAISYRVHQGFSHEDVALSIGVQKMVRADLAAAGVIFTLDTESGFRDAVFITAAYGLGETVVQGSVNPDEFYVFKPTLENGYQPILKRQLGTKEVKEIYTEDTWAGLSTRKVPVRKPDRLRFCITDDEVLKLAHAAVTIERHYSARNNKPTPMDIEWAKDGETGKLYIVQARPETVESTRNGSAYDVYRMEEQDCTVLSTGKSVGSRIASGPARTILEAADMHELKPGEILVTEMTDPDWEPVMKVAGAIVTERGGRTCHAAIVARELGIPAIVGTADATQTVTSGEPITVSCAEGDTGYIYEGACRFTSEEIDLGQLPDPRTHLMVNIGNPEQAFSHSRLPAYGVGLARLEFIINNTIRIHPRALLEFDQLESSVQQQINELTAGYPDRKSFYTKRLAEGVGMIAAAFHPRPVIVRMSDFKSNEYAQLIGGEAFEPEEENPMLGFRGAARYFSEDFAEAFALECQAMKMVRDAMGLANVALMVPFVRTVEEGRNVLELMKREGLVRGENGLKIYLMCEIPANALLADDFLAEFDGFSIGSNDLTQLTLGVDRDSGVLTGFDERNQAVLDLMSKAIDACQRHEKYVGICGQAPSDYPEITRWLVNEGIESISLNPDSLLPMLKTVLEAEGKAKASDLPAGGG